MNNQTSYELHELRRRSGRTWKGMARWFAVDPQTVQGWTRGDRMGIAHRRFMADLMQADWAPRRFRPVVIQGGKKDSPVELPRFAHN